MPGEESIAYCESEIKQLEDDIYINKVVMEGYDESIAEESKKQNPNYQQINDWVCQRNIVKVESEEWQHTLDIQKQRLEMMKAAVVSISSFD